jgi:hypothetical protein
MEVDLFSFLSSVNKIGLIAFLLTSGFLAYQFYLIKKEIKNTSKVKQIPDFIEKGDISTTAFKKEVILKEEKKSFKRYNKLSFIITLLVFLSLGGYLIFTFKVSRVPSGEPKSFTVTPIIKFVASNGIKIYNQKWEEISEDKIDQLKPGELILVALSTIENADIDKARIRINKDRWEKDDETINYNQQKKVFFKEYQIATDSPFLRIEGQLHSKVDGWLTE